MNQNEKKRCEALIFLVFPCLPENEICMGLVLYCFGSFSDFCSGRKIKKKKRDERRRRNREEKNTNIYRIRLNVYICIKCSVCWRPFLYNILYGGSERESHKRPRTHLYTHTHNAHPTHTIKHIYIEFFTLNIIRFD